MSDRRIKLMISIVDLAAGTGVFARNLGTGLRRFYRNEFEVILLSFRDEPLSNDDRRCFDQTHSLQIKVKPGVRQVLELPTALRRMRHAIAELKPDIILSVHTFANWLSSTCAGDVPVVLTDHLNLTCRHAARGRLPFGKSMLRKMYAKHMVVGVSEEISQDLRQHFGATRTATILNGINIEQIKSQAIQTPSVELPGPYVVAVGRLFEQKDYPTLIRAFDLARKEGLKLDLVIVGDGPERANLQQLIGSTGIAQYVHLIGHQDNPFPYVQRARMLAMSSIYEGFGLVLAEALALGIPCVSTHCPSGPAEILEQGEYGLLVPPQEPEKLAKAMLQLDTDQALRQQLIEKAPYRAEQLGMELMTRRYRELLIAELKNAGNPP